MVRDALARREGISAEEDRDRSDILDRVDAASAWLEKTEGLGARDDDDDARPPIVVVQRCGVLGRPPTGKVRSISHWFPYDRVRVVNADP